MLLQIFKKKLLNGLFALLNQSKGLRREFIECPKEAGEEIEDEIDESMDLVNFLQSTSPIREKIGINVGKVLNAFVFPEPVCDGEGVELPLVPSSMFEIKTFLINTLDSLSRLSSMIFDKKYDATKRDARQCEHALESELESILEILDDCNRECATILEYCTNEELKCESGEPTNERRK